MGSDEKIGKYGVRLPLERKKKNENKVEAVEVFVLF